MYADSEWGRAEWGRAECSGSGQRGEVVGEEEERVERGDEGDGVKGGEVESSDRDSGDGSGGGEGEGGRDREGQAEDKYERGLTGTKGMVLLPVSAGSESVFNETTCSQSSIHSEKSQARKLLEKQDE